MTSPIPRLTRLSISNYRSIGEDWIDIDFPPKSPLVLVGENNAGKSNILRALSLLLGDYWPGNADPEDHEFHGRSPQNIEMGIRLSVGGMYCPKCIDSPITEIRWTYAKANDQPCEFVYKGSRCRDDSHYMNNEIRSQLTCISVSPDRDIAYQMSYASKWTLLSKLMRKFHDRLIGDASRVEKLKEFFDQLVGTFYEVEEFSKFAELLRSSTEDFGGNLPYGLDIDFSAYDASNFYRSLRLFPKLDGEFRAYEEMGTGQGQILAISFAYAYAQAFGGSGLILAVEEPETHLHPLAQQWLANKLVAVTESGVQVVLTTHSPTFIDLAVPGSKVLVRKRGEGRATTVLQLKSQQLVNKVVELGAPERVTVTNVGEFYENSATEEIKSGLLARGCLLVEGSSEQLGLPVLLGRLGFDLTKLGIAVIPVGGVGNLAKWIRFFKAYEIPVFPVFDTDSDKTGKTAAERRSNREEIISCIGLGAGVDWEQLVSGPIGVHEKFAVFDSNYETAMRSVFGDTYVQLESVAREELGASKPLIARYVAKNIPISTGLDEPPLGWQFLIQIGDRIEELPATWQP